MRRRIHPEDTPELTSYAGRKHKICPPYRIWHVNANYIHKTHPHTYFCERIYLMSLSEVIPSRKHNIHRSIRLFKIILATFPTQHIAIYIQLDAAIEFGVRNVDTVSKPEIDAHILFTSMVSLYWKSNAKKDFAFAQQPRHSPT